MSIESKKAEADLMFGRKITTQKELDSQRLNFERMGCYPLSMTDCEVVGIRGDCGKDCPVLHDGRCPIIDEIKDDNPEMLTDVDMALYDR